MGAQDNIPVEAPAKSFLSLPPEIRNLIYRRLLVQKETLKNHRAKLNPQVLATCRQIFREARGILYGENTWELKVSNVQDPASGTTCSYPPPLHPPPSWHLGSPGYRRQPSRSRAKLMRRFCLTVDHDDNADAGSCRLTQERLERVCDALERVRRIEYLRLDVKCSGVYIDKCTWEKEESDYQNVPFTERQRRGFGGRQEMVAILQTWLGGCFRKIKTVEIVGLSEQRASTLKGSLMGKDPLDLEIPNMCDIMRDGIQEARALCTWHLEQSLRAGRQRNMTELMRLKDQMIREMKAHFDDMSAEMEEGRQLGPDAEIEEQVPGTERMDLRPEGEGKDLGSKAEVFVVTNDTSANNISIK